MAAKLNTRQCENVRANIDTSLLVKRLLNHAAIEVDYTEMGYAKPPKGFMTPSQISAAKILLDKALSNAPTEIIADIDSTLNIIINKPQDIKNE